MTKRTFICLLLTLACILTLCACDGGSDGASDRSAPSAENTEPVSVEAPEPEPTPDPGPTRVDLETYAGGAAAAAELLENLNGRRAFNTSVSSLDLTYLKEIPTPVAILVEDWKDGRDTEYFFLSCSALDTAASLADAKSHILIRAYRNLYDSGFGANYDKYAFFAAAPGYTAVARASSWMKKSDGYFLFGTGGVRAELADQELAERLESEFMFSQDAKDDFTVITDWLGGYGSVTHAELYDILEKSEPDEYLYLRAYLSACLYDPGTVKAALEAAGQDPLKCGLAEDGRIVSEEDFVRGCAKNIPAIWEGLDRDELLRPLLAGDCAYLPSEDLSAYYREKDCVALRSDLLRTLGEYLKDSSPLRFARYFPWISEEMDSSKFQRPELENWIIDNSDDAVYSDFKAEELAALLRKQAPHYAQVKEVAGLALLGKYTDIGNVYRPVYRFTLVDLDTGTAVVLRQQEKLLEAPDLLASYSVDRDRWDRPVVKYPVHWKELLEGTV